jgi:sialic acid synthase SpsE
MLIRASADAGVDAVKFQVYEADEIVSHRILPEAYGLQSLYPDMTMHQVFDQHLKTPKKWFPELSDYARELGLVALATAHSGSGAKFIEEHGMSAIKIASMDMTNLPVLSDIIAASHIPILFSTGLCDLNEIHETVQLLENANRTYAMLHCVANYPPRANEIRLQNIKVLKALYKVPIGFSDHSVDSDSAVAAVVLGASIIEKHITLNRADKGPDHPFALEPQDFKALVQSIRRIEKALDPQAGFVGPLKRELDNQPLFRRSLVAATDIPSGTEIRPEHIKISRPGTGIAPKFLEIIYGRKATVDIKQETPLQWEYL